MLRDHHVFAVTYSTCAMRRLKEWWDFPCRCSRFWTRWMTLELLAGYRKCAGEYRVAWSGKRYKGGGWKRIPDSKPLQRRKHGKYQVECFNAALDYKQNCKTLGIVRLATVSGGELPFAVFDIVRKSLQRFRFAVDSISCNDKTFVMKSEQRKCTAVQILFDWAATQWVRATRTLSTKNLICVQHLDTNWIWDRRHHN